MVVRDQGWLCERIMQVSNMPVPKVVEVITDTTEFMSIHRGQVLKLDGSDYLVTGTVYESRFGMSDEPKYWVKKAIDLEKETQHIVKLVYAEEFHACVGPLRIRCYRKPTKESEVLRLVCDDPRFMHGYGAHDARGNEVRVIEYIRGKSLYNVILEMGASHERYFHAVFPGIFRKLIDMFAGIQHLHAHGLCHGDIRNDHIMVEHDTENYRWIDFDLMQDYSDFDVWSLGNVLQFCVGMGMRTFHDVLRSNDFSETVKRALTSDDSSAFYEHRIMNLRKLFPYIPDRLSDILLHFARNTTRFYETVNQIVSDMGEAMADLPAA
jgi:hypothetical protein